MASSSLQKSVDDAPLAALAAALPAYAIGPMIGHGGEAAVLAGEHRDTARSVAIKLLAGPALDADDARDRLRTEAHVLSRCTHRNLVELVEFHELETMVVLIVGRVAGRSLAGVLGDHPPLGLHRSCQVMSDVGAALAEIHRRGFVHCDVKPENVLLDADGTATLIDLGLARPFPTTPAATVSGTPWYMAPEQACCAELLPATDVYACGMMLYELLAGHFPFPPADTTASVMRQQVELRPAPLHEVAPHVPRPVADVVMASIDKRLAHRIPTAEAFVERLADALGSRSR